MSPLFLSLALALSLLSISAQTLKLSQRRDSGLLLFFLSKSLGVQDDSNVDVYHQAPLKVKEVISHWLSHGVDRAKILPKFLGCMDNQIISPMVLHCTLCACESSYPSVLCPCWFVIITYGCRLIHDMHPVGCKDWHVDFYVFSKKLIDLFLCCLWF